MSYLCAEGARLQLAWHQASPLPPKPYHLMTLPEIERHAAATANCAEVELNNYRAHRDTCLACQPSTGKDLRL